MDPLATIILNTLNVNSEEFQNFMTLKYLAPKEDVKSEPDTEMSNINYEDNMGTPSTTGYSVKMKVSRYGDIGCYDYKTCQKRA